jgi:gamma-D-glutamyl-L-lysine dipeptidyl-peptidase
MAEVVSQAIYATSLKIGDSSDGWVQVKTPDDYEGWMERRHIFESKRSYPSSELIGRVNGLWTHVFFVSDTTPHLPKITLPYGTKVEIVAAPEKLDQRWVRARLLDGGLYWVQSGDFDFSGRRLSLDEMIEEGRRFIGIPYLWGGSSSFGFDCSGLVQTLFLQMGIQLPRDAALQAANASMHSIPAGDLQKGDLVFFGKSPERITHVGLYLGSGQFLHSVTTNKTGPHAVQVGKLRDPEWNRIFISAMRCLSIAKMMD